MPASATSVGSLIPIRLNGRHKLLCSRVLMKRVQLGDCRRRRRHGAQHARRVSQLVSQSVGRSVGGLTKRVPLNYPQRLFPRSVPSGLSVAMFVHSLDRSRRFRLLSFARV